MAKKTFQKNNVQNLKKVKYNFDFQIVNLRINKYINAKLLKLNMLYMRGSHHH